MEGTSPLTPERLEESVPHGVWLTSQEKNSLPLKLGVIDLGSNSIHLAIVQVWEDFSYTFLHTDRTQIRLGSPVFDAGFVDPQTESKTLATLKKFKKSCQTHQVDVILTVATSALREASNSADIIRRIKEHVGLEVVVISGREEARLTALAATDSLGLTTGKVLVMDVGGGSTEVAWLEDSVPVHLWSFHLGPVRILEQVEIQDPPGIEGLEALRAVTRKSLGPVLRAKLGRPDWTLGTSGTALCLGDMCGTKERARTSLEVSIIFRASLKNLLERLAEMPQPKRAEWLGEHAERADTIIPGGMILLTAMEELDLDTLVTGGKALRVGIVLDFLQRRFHSTAKDRAARLVHLSKQGASFEGPRDIRSENILKLARRYGYDLHHCNQVLDLANQIFDGIKNLYWMGEEDRFYLQSAALLHDIGYHINNVRHHLHSQYLVTNSEIEGFHEMELKTIGNLVRYHSKEWPALGHPDYGSMPEGLREKVDVLAGILRIADALDFTHQGHIQGLSVEPTPGALHIRIEARGAIDLELEEARIKGDLLAHALKRKLEFEIETPELPTDAA